MSSSKDDVNDMMLKMLGDAITHVIGIDRESNRNNSDEQVEKLRALENKVFHFGLFSDLIEGDTKAESKAIMNNLMSNDLYKVSDKQLRLTPYIFYKASLLVQEDKINQAFSNNSDIIHKPDLDQANETAVKISMIMLDTIRNMGALIDKNTGKNVK